MEKTITRPLTGDIGSVVELDAKDWNSQVLESKQPVLVDFWHDACVWCKRLDPELAAVAKELDGKLKFAKLNIFANEGNEKLGTEYGIMGTPTLLLFCNGRPVDSIVGYKPRNALKDDLLQKLENAQDCISQSTRVER